MGMYVGNVGPKMKNLKNSLGGIYVFQLQIHGRFISHVLGFKM